MNIDRKFKIEAVALPAKDTTRPVLNCVNIQSVWPHAMGEQAVAMTSNGFVAVIVPVELGEDDVTGLLPATALKLARERTFKYLQPEIILGADVLTFQDKSTMPRHIDGMFPDLRRLVPDLGTQEEDPGHTFAFNISYLKMLADALGCTQLIFRRVTKTGVVLVKGFDNVPHTDADWTRAPFGLLMPMTTP